MICTITCLARKAACVPRPPNPCLPDARGGTPEYLDVLWEGADTYEASLAKVAGLLSPAGTYKYQLQESYVNDALFTLLAEHLKGMRCFAVSASP